MIRKQISKLHSAMSVCQAERMQRGQAVVEYMAVCAALTFALFVPIQDNPASPDEPRTTWEIVVNGFQEAYRNISYAISLPS